MKKNGLIITLSGISGAGKSHFIKCALTQLDNFEKLKAVTTRERRREEIDGVDKYFISNEEFKLAQQNNELAVVNNVFGNMYAYYKSEFNKIERGTSLITELYYKEVAKFKKDFPNTLSIYILPNDIAHSIRELKERGIDSEELNRRIIDINAEIDYISKHSNEFDLIITNDYSIKSVNNFINQVSAKLETKHIYLNKTINKLEEKLDENILNTVKNYEFKNRKSVVYTSFDGDDMNYLHDICDDVIKDGKIPLNPESALGYYVSTVCLGGDKTKVMTDCLTLEMFANELYIYETANRDLSEGIVAEIVLWTLMKNERITFVNDVKKLEDRKTKVLSFEETSEWLNSQDKFLQFELKNNLLNQYMSTHHSTAYIIANFANYKHLDWARAYCYNNGLCPISPQNILPFYLYKNNEKEYLEARLELLRRADKILLFADQYNLHEDLESFDKFSVAELLYLKNNNRTFKIIGWDEASVPKYNPNKKWSLSTKEDIKVRKLIKQYEN